MPSARLAIRHPTPHNTRGYTNGVASFPLSLPPPLAPAYAFHVGVASYPSMFSIVPLRIYVMFVCLWASTTRLRSHALELYVCTNTCRPIFNSPHPYVLSTSTLFTTLTSSALSSASPPFSRWTSPLTPRAPDRPFRKRDLASIALRWRNLLPAPGAFAGDGVPRSPAEEVALRPPGFRLLPFPLVLSAVRRARRELSAAAPLREALRKGWGILAHPASSACPLVCST